MRPPIVLTAASAVVVIAWGVATAQDNFFGRPVATFGTTTGSPAVEPAAQTSPTEIPGVKNYFGELFGRAASAAQPPTGLRTASGAADRSAKATQARFEASAEAANPFANAQIAADSPAAPEMAKATTEDQPLPTPVSEKSTEQLVPAPPADAAPATPEQTAAPAANLQNMALPTIDISNAQATTAKLGGMYVAGPAALGMRWERHGEVTVGREHECVLVVANTGASSAGDVTIEAFLPPELKLISADPAPTRSGDRLSWKIPALAAGSNHRIALKVIPAQQGDLQISAVIHHTEASATMLAVRQPQLLVKVTGPREVPIGETVAQEITVSNPGTGTSEDVSVEITLPAGLEHAKGKTLVMPVGSLAAGQSQVIRVALYATGGGPQPIHVRATGGPDLVHEASISVMVAAPTLAIETEGPSLRYVGREAVYQIRVTNTGGAVANNVRIVHALPTGFRFIRADKGGTYEPGTSEVIWYLGRLESGHSAVFSTELMAAALGDHAHKITATSEGGATAETTVATTVDGTASLVVDVIDLDDPIEVGSETAYEIRVRNEGTKSAMNVEIGCIVPEGVTALSARGPTVHQGNTSQLTFAPIRELAPGKTALYRVIVKGTGAGKHRFQVRLSSESIDEPLVHEELTHFYAD